MASIIQIAKSLSESDTDSYGPTIKEDLDKLNAYFADTLNITIEEEAFLFKKAGSIPAEEFACKQDKTLCNLLLMMASHKNGDKDKEKGAEKLLEFVHHISNLPPEAGHISYKVLDAKELTKEISSSTLFAERDDNSTVDHAAKKLEARNPSSENSPSA